MEINPYNPQVSKRYSVPPRVESNQLVRPRVLIQATLLACAAISAGFIGLLSHYIAERAMVINQGERWLPEGVNIPLTQPNFQGLTLAFSFITIWWAYRSVKDGDRFYTMSAAGLSLLFATAYIAQTFFLLSIMDMDLSWSKGSDGERSVLIATIIGSHLVLMVLAMVYTVIMALRVLGGVRADSDAEGMMAAAIYWTVMVVLYAVMWYVIYITK